MLSETIFSRLALCACLLFPYSAFSGNQKEEALASHLLFIENKNQWEDFIHYRANIHGGRIFLEKDRFTYVFFHPEDLAALHSGHGSSPSLIRLHALRMTMQGANPKPIIGGGAAAPYKHNYFIGSDTSHWAKDVRLFGEVRYQEVYPGIDLKLYSQETNLKYDFLVNPGADASVISLQYEGADRIDIEEGRLKISTSVGEIFEQKPYAYQLMKGRKVEVPCSYRLTGSTVRYFFPEGYNKAWPLVIDPILVFASYTGSLSDNWGFTATYDGLGNAYAGGNVQDIGYPVSTGAYQANFGGGGTSGSGFSCDMAIAKFNADGTSLLYATYLGGNDNEQPQSLVVDNQNNLFIYGITFSPNFPVTPGSYHQTPYGLSDIVVCKLGPDGNQLLASTRMGGANDDGINTTATATIRGSIKYNYGDDSRGEILMDPSGNVLVASCTRSSNFPTTAGSYQPVFAAGGQDGVLFKMNPLLSDLLWCTYLGGTGMDAAYSCAFDSTGNIYVTGGTTSTDFPTTPLTLHPGYQGGSADGYVAHLSSNGALLLHSTFLGTTSYDQTFFVQLDHSGDVYVTGQTEGTYPVTPGVYSNANSSQFIHKLSADLATTGFSTVFGSGTYLPNISPTAFLVDTCGNIYVSGWGRCNLAGFAYTISSTAGMPVTADALQSTTDGCDFYFIVLSENAAGLLYATYFGGPLSQEHVDGGTSRFDKNGVIYQSVCAGCGGHSDFPTTPGVVSGTNGSLNCNNAIAKVKFNFSKTYAVADGSPVSGCAPLTVHFTNQSINAIHYAWHFDDGSPTSPDFEPSHTFTTLGPHQVMLITRNNVSCNLADTAYVLITVTPPPPLTAGMNLVPPPACDSLSIQVLFTGTGGNSYAWNFGDGTHATGTAAQHTFSQPGNYSVTLLVRDTVCLVADSISQPVTLRAILDAGIAPGALFGCAPELFSLASTYGGPGTLIWDFGDGSIANGSPVSHAFLTPGNYPVRLVLSDTASCNLSDTAWFNLDVFLKPRAGFLYDLLPEYWPGREITFTDTSELASQLQWDFGDHQTSADSVVKHRYLRGGTYNICLMVSNDDGCLDTACRTLEVIDTENIYVPNSFTPNRDGKNDFFFPATIGILDMQVRIYNRWGQLVASWQGLDGAWDGNFHGSPAKKDVYIYEIHAVGSITPSIVRTGRVTLVR